MMALRGCAERRHFEALARPTSKVLEASTHSCPFALPPLQWHNKS
jgi:hypothetical protein